MRNWSTDVTQLDTSSSSYQIWKLEQLINFGLDGEKLDRNVLKKHLSELNIDPFKKSLLKFLLDKHA